jgi:glycosyltransferase involved in cell wall biosynthesis
MLIVHLITDLDVGGAESLLKELVLRSDQNRFRHVVISLQRGGVIVDELKAAGIEVYSLGLKGAATIPLGMVRLIRWLRNLKPDILHCWLYHGCLMGSLGARLGRVQKVIWGLHSANPALKGYSFLTRVVVRLSAKQSSSAAVIVAVSEECWRAHRDLGFLTTRMRVIGNGVDTRRFSPDGSARKSVLVECGFDADSVLIGLFARFSPMKDHATFLHAGRLVLQRWPRVRFLLAGNGVTQDNQPLNQVIRDAGLGDVTCLLGTRRDMPRLTAALDIACLSSWSESFGNVIAEAMSCEKPCVVTRVGDLASMVGETGRVVAPRDPTALATALNDLIGMRPEERTALGASARERILSKFSLEATVHAYESVYTELG